MKDIYLYGLSDDCHEAQVFYDRISAQIVDGEAVLVAEKVTP